MSDTLNSFILAALVSVSPSDAGESVSIVRIVEDPQTYHLRTVTLQGTVRQVQRLQPYFLADVFMCYGAYRFILDDRTGSIEIGVRGICGTPAMRFPEIIKPEVSEGDRILVDAEIHAPGGYTGDGFPLFGDVLETVKAIASKFHHIARLD
jgi:hypothetical protein